MRRILEAEGEGQVGARAEETEGEEQHVFEKLS